MNVSYLMWIPLFPLFGAMLNGFLTLMTAHKKEGPPKALVAWIACLMPTASFVVTLMGFLALRGLPEPTRWLAQRAMDWISIGPLDLPINFLLDPLSAAMLL